MIYLVFRTQINEQGRQDLEGLWRWVKAREPWFYTELPMVRGVKRYVTRVGPSYTVETGLTQDPIAPREGGFFAYFHRMAELRAELEEVGGREVELVAVEGFGWLLDDLPERMRAPAELIRAIRLTESEPTMLGVSAHVIAVARA